MFLILSLYHYYYYYYYYFSPIIINNSNINSPYLYGHLQNGRIMLCVMPFRRPSLHT